MTPQGVAGVWIYSLEEGTARRVADGTMGSWFADGRRLAYLNPNGIFVLDTVSGVSSELIQTPGITIGAGAHLAAGDSQLFYLQGEVSGDIWLVKFAQPDKAR